MFPPRGRRLAGRRAVTIRVRQLGLNRPLNSRNGVLKYIIIAIGWGLSSVDHDSSAPRILEKSWVNPNLRRLDVLAAREAWPKRDSVTVRSY